MNQSELAQVVGVEAATISQYITLKRAPSLEVLAKMAGVFGVSIPEFFACKDDEAPDIEFVERVTARPRAGTGGLETDAEHNGHYAFHKSFLVRKGAPAKDMKIFEVAGDSMEPLLSDSDLIMVNIRDKDVRTGRVYLLRIGEDLMVKRLEIRPGGVLLIRSDNKEYEDIPVNLHETQDVEVFGRMVWSCREY